jgi:DNA modification methylase
LKASVIQLVEGTYVWRGTNRSVAASVRQFVAEHPKLISYENNRELVEVNFKEITAFRFAIALRTSAASIHRSMRDSGFKPNSLNQYSLSDVCSVFQVDEDDLKSRIRATYAY